MRRWQWKFRFERDTNYYFGLFLLVVASATLIWAIWKDAFEPQDFLVYFIIYGWGYILLLKSDMEFRCQRMEKKIMEVLARLEALETPMERGEGASPPSGELFPGPPGAGASDAGVTGAGTTSLPLDFSVDGSAGEPGGEPGGEAGGETGARAREESGEESREEFRGEPGEESGEEPGEEPGGEPPESGV